MNYPFADADWLAEYLPKTTLYRKVSAGILTLGHLRTAEACGVRFFNGQESSFIDWGILITISQKDWRKSRLKAVKAGLLWLWKRDRNTPRTIDEAHACMKWWKQQNYFPTRTLLKQEEQAQINELSSLGKNRASTAVQRLAMSVCRVKGWQTLTNCDSVWDVPMISATHILIANAELDGAFHVPYDMIRMALNGKN